MDSLKASKGRRVPSWWACSGIPRNWRILSLPCSGSFPNSWKRPANADPAPPRVCSPMNREYHRWYSPALGHEMELLIFGHGGARLLVYPTSLARFYEWEDRGMIGALHQHLERGWVQAYCLDGIDREAWYARHRHP